jgi:hypothetical protein
MAQVDSTEAGATAPHWRYLQVMALSRSIAALAPMSLLASLAGALAACSIAAGATTTTTPTSTSGHTPLEKSPDLGATVNLCNTHAHPDTIGVRGSMPTDGHRHDVMYMRFQVQDLDATTHKWADVGKSADSGFVEIGSAAATRQAGRSFEFQSAGATYTLRGLVEFQWRRHGHTVHAASRTTTVGHTSLAGAEPKGFSAATCALS